MLLWMYTNMCNCAMKDLRSVRELPVEMLSRPHNSELVDLDTLHNLCYHHHTHHKHRVTNQVSLDCSLAARNTSAEAQKHDDALTGPRQMQL